MNPILVEGKFGHGGLGHFIKPTDWLAHNFVGGDSTPFDWSIGYDVENEIATLLKEPGFQLPTKNQGQAGSCGGEALGYKAEVDRTFKDGKFTESSAKYSYAQVFQPGGGSMGGDLMTLYKTQGVSSEALCSSYQYAGMLPPSEVFMEAVGDITVQARADAKSTLVPINYAFIIDFDIDTLAQAVRDNRGIIIGIYGQNNGSWLGHIPQKPAVTIGSGLLWGHWLFVKGACMIDGVKYLIVINSWGKSVGQGGRQLISEDYVSSGYLQLGMKTFSATSISYQFSKDLYMGMTDVDVFFLQKKLNSNSSTQITQTGPGSPGDETYYFGALTQAAVIRYQNLKGIRPAIGYVGPMTRASLNASS